MDTSSLVVLTVGMALVFGVINGIHDAANSVATIVSTRLLSPLAAVLWAASFNFAAVFVFHHGVARTVSSLVHVSAADPAFVWVVLSGLIGAVIWNVLTWWLAIPSSSSHALMGGFSGAGLAYGGFAVLNGQALLVTAGFVLISPAIGFALGSLLLVALSWLLRDFRPSPTERLFRAIRLLSAAGYSLGHGGNDAQKTMGIILAVLIAGGHHTPGADEAPLWVSLSCYGAIALGTATGGWRIIRTLGVRLTKLRPPDAFCAEISGALTLFGATMADIPVSTTHTITSAIVGVGSTRKVRGIRWGLASSILWAWVLTIPASAAMAALCLTLLRALGSW